MLDTTGTSLIGFTVNVTRLVPTLSAVPSLTLYSNVISPKKLSVGVYINEPSVLRVKFGSMSENNITVSVSPSASVALLNKLLLSLMGSVKLLSSSKLKLLFPVNTGRSLTALTVKVTLA